MEEKSEKWWEGGEEDHPSQTLSAKPVDEKKKKPLAALSDSRLTQTSSG